MDRDDGAREGFEVNGDLAVSRYREIQVGTVADHRQQVCPRRQTRNMGNVVLGCAERDRERAAVLGHKYLLGVEGIPIRNVLNNVAAALNHLERHLPQILRCRIGSYGDVHGVADSRVVDVRFLLGRDPCGELLEGDKLHVLRGCLRDEIREHLRRVGRGRAGGPGRCGIVMDRPDDNRRAGRVGGQCGDLGCPVGLRLRHGLALILHLGEIEDDVRSNVDRALARRAHVANGIWITRANPSPAPSDIAGVAGAGLVVGQDRLGRGVGFGGSRYRRAVDRLAKVCGFDALRLIKLIVEGERVAV